MERYVIIIDGEVCYIRDTMRDASAALNNSLIRNPTKDIILAKILTEYGGIFDGKR